MGLDIFSAIITVGSLVYAVMTNREKRKLEKLVKSMLAGIAGNIRGIRENPAWADQQFRNIRERALELERNDDVKAILQHAHDGARDVTAAERMLGDLLGEVLWLQKGLFGTELIYHPNRKDEHSNGLQSDEKQPREVLRREEKG